MSALPFLFSAVVCFVAFLPDLARSEITEPEWGQVPTQHFSARDYGGHPQSFDIVQGRDDHIFVANGLGVLEFDGVRWQLHKTARGTGAFSLELGADGRIHVGAQGEIGYLDADAKGELAFVSLNDRIPEQDRNFSTVWFVERTDAGIHYVSREAIFLYDGESVQVMHPQANFARAYRVGKDLVVQDSGVGVFKVEPQGLIRIDALDALKGKTLAGAFELPEGTVYCGRDSQCLLHDDDGLRPWSTAVDARMAPDLLYTGTQLADQRIVLATLGNGVYLLDTEGRLVRHFSADAGLPTGTIYKAFEDRLGGLWLATDRGIVRLALSSPISTFDRSSGLLGMVLAVHRHLGQLYVGTGTGLFQLEDGRFHQQAGFRDITWTMISFEDQMLVGGDQGVYRLHEGVADRVRAPHQRQVNALMRSQVDPDRVFVGSVDGLASVRHTDGGWVDEGPVSAITEHSRMLLEMDDGRLWIATQHQGVLRVTFPADWVGGDSAEAVIERFDESHGLPGTFNINIYRIGGEVLFSSVEAGVYRFDEDSSRFQPDARFTRAIGQPQFTINPMAEDETGRIWLDLGEVKGILEPQPGGEFRWQTAPLAPVAEQSVYVIHTEPEGPVWLGGADGLIRFDKRQSKDYELPFKAAVRRVERPGEGLLLGPEALAQSPELPWESHAVRLEFAAAAFDFLDANRYQTRLDGLDRDWSSWSTETYRDYTNLREGRYTFRVRSRNAYGTLSEEALFRFSVLPPIYRSWWAWILYGAGFIVLLWAFQRWRLRRLRAQKQALERLVSERTAELEDAYRSMTSISVTDQLTGLRNRHFLAMHMEGDAVLARRAHADWATRRRQSPPDEDDLIFFLVDIDHFKAVNDSHGHAAGDRALVHVGQLLSRTFRESDYVVRWGGEEFLAVARFVNRERAADIAERIRKVIADAPLDLDDKQSITLTCSIGFACYPFVPEQAAALGWMQIVDIADRCLYTAKRDQRNTWVGAYALTGFAQFDELLAAHTPADSIREIPGLQIVSPDRGASIAASSATGATAGRLSEDA